MVEPTVDNCYSHAPTAWKIDIAMLSRHFDGEPAKRVIQCDLAFDGLWVIKNRVSHLFTFWTLVKNAMLGQQVSHAKTAIGPNRYQFWLWSKNVAKDCCALDEIRSVLTRPGKTVVAAMHADHIGTGADPFHGLSKIVAQPVGDRAKV